MFKIFVRRDPERKFVASQLALFTDSWAREAISATPLGATTRTRDEAKPVTA